MYVAKLNRPAPTDNVPGFIQQHPFGLLIATADTGEPLAVHVPILLRSNAEGGQTLVTHVARANPIWRLADGQRRWLAVFSGPHAYVSASWYDHENVSTWNYISVHVYGAMRVLSDEETLQALADVTDQFEHGRAGRVAVDTYSPGFVQREMRGMVALEMAVDDMQAAYKLSQNRDDANYANVVKHMADDPDPAAQQTADLMRQRRNLPDAT